MQNRWIDYIGSIPFGLLDGNGSKSKCVTDHRNTAETHRRRGDHWAQQPSKDGIKHSRGNRDPQGVVSEGKKQILPDVCHCRSTQGNGFEHTAQVTSNKRRIGLLDRNVAARAHRNADVRRR